jgi:hypothetical protein
MAELIINNTSANVALVPNRFMNQLRDISKVLIDKPYYMQFLVKAIDFLTAFPNWNEELLWDKQRPINEENVREIVHYLDGKSSDLRLVNQMVTIATVVGGDSRIIDGQHRLKALLNITEDTEFQICVCDYQSNQQRFIEFCKINDNTPLPAYYKSITDYESYTRTLSDMLAKEIQTNYPHLFDNAGVYSLNIANLTTKLYDEINRRGIEMGVFNPIIVNILQELERFPTQSMSYPRLPVNPNKCKCQKSQTNKMEQCPNSAKREYEGRCGTHFRSRTDEYSTINIRNRRFEEIHVHRSGYFSLNPDWIREVFERVYPSLL